MKKSFFLILLILPRVLYAQTYNKIKVNQLQGKDYNKIEFLDSIYISKLRATQEIKAPLYKQGVDTLATKAYMRHLLSLISESDPVFSASVAFHIKASDTTRWASGGSFPYTKTLTDNVTWLSDGNHDFDLGSTTISQNPLHTIIRSQYETSLYSNYGIVILGSPAGTFTLGNNSVLFTQNNGTGGIEYAGNYAMDEYSLITKHKLDSTVAAHSGGLSSIASDTFGQLNINAYDIYHTPIKYRNIYTRHLTSYGGFVNDFIITDCNDSVTINSTGISFRNAGYFGSLTGGLLNFYNSTLTKNLTHLAPIDSRGNYLFNTYSTINDTASIIIIANNGVTKVKIKGNGMVMIGNDTIPVRKSVASDTTGLTGRVGDTFIDTAKKYWYNTHNGRGGWVKLNYMLPFAILFRKRKQSKFNIS